jgi:hypothetical protein
MSEPNRTDEFLNAATAGLKKDRELQLDVRAELRSHLDAHQQEAEAAGLTTDAATDEAIRAMGGAAELAEDLERANRHRMHWRALIRMAAQWLLAPVAIVVAVLTTDWGAFTILRAFQLTPVGPTDNWTPRGLTPDQKLILHGDLTKPTTLERQKAIWDKWPDNKVYLHNYFTYLVSDCRNWSGPMTSKHYAMLTAEIAKLRPKDPENARFDYILAGTLLDQAVEEKPRKAKKSDGKAKTEYDFIVKDRAKLDAAMAYYKAGLAKPEFHRYTREITSERLTLMGRPTSIQQEIAEIGVAAATLLPDLSYLRKLIKTSVFYGELLAKEGRRTEADVFLNSYRRFIPQINSDAFTLIDVLGTGAFASYAHKRIPAIYEKLGDTNVAKQAETELAALDAPVTRWKEKKKAFDNTPAGQTLEQDLKQRASILGALLIPALGERPTTEELAPCRQVEYVMFENNALGTLLAVLFLVMAGCGLAAIYYRWWRGGRNDTLLLLPAVGEVVRLLTLGVLLPLLGYYVITRWLPWQQREVNIAYVAPLFFAQLLTLAFVIVGTTLSLAERAVQRRCRELLLPVPPPSHRAWKIVIGCFFGLLALLCFLPESLLGLRDNPPSVLCLPVAVLALLVVIVWFVYGTLRNKRYGKSCAAYYGSVARTMIPVFALALILVNLCSQPYLRWSERRWLAADTITRPDPNGGFTVIETRIVKRLKAEIQQAADALPPR